MKYILCRAEGTRRSIDKPNKRKIHTNTLFHLGFVHRSGYQGGESPSNAGRPTLTHTYTDNNNR